jgi:hypothetical protein
MKMKWGFVEEQNRSGLNFLIAKSGRLAGLVGIPLGKSIGVWPPNIEGSIDSKRALRICSARDCKKASYCSKLRWLLRHFHWNSAIY